EDHHAAAADFAADAVPRGDAVLRVKGHARDAALLDHDGLGPQPLSLRVEQHQAAAGVGGAAVPRGDAALRVEGHTGDEALLALQRSGSHPLPAPVEEHHAAALEDAVPCGDAALEVDGHAPNSPFGNVEELDELGAMVEATLQAPARFERVFD